MLNEEEKRIIIVKSNMERPLSDYPNELYY